MGRQCFDLRDFMYHTLEPRIVPGNVTCNKIITLVADLFKPGAKISKLYGVYFLNLLQFSFFFHNLLKSVGAPQKSLQ